VNENDDAISTSRYAMMMLQRGRTDNNQRAMFNAAIEFPNLAVV
jgi:hypothetical protein